MNKQALQLYLRQRLASFRNDLEPEILKSELYKGLLKVFADSVKNFRDESLSKDLYWLNKWCDLKKFTLEEQAVLNYFFPLAPLIQRDVLLLEQALSTVFEVPVNISKEGLHNYIIIHDGAPIEEIILDAPKQKLGGITKDFRINYKVTIGPLTHHHLAKWLGDGRSLWFAERGLLPLLIQPIHRFSIEVIPDAHYNQYTKDEIDVFLDVNAILA